MFDALTAKALAWELNSKIARGRVQGVISLDDLTIGLEIYANHTRFYLLASADPTNARIHLVSDKLRASGETPSPFVLLLRKYADGSFVNSVEAVAHERILRIEFDHSQFGVSTLVVEVMDRLANLILIDSSAGVLDAIKRVTPSMSRARTIQPKSRYFPPPPQVKADPLTLRAEELSDLLKEERGRPLWQVLVRSIAGMSPLFARELVFRVVGGADALSDPALAVSLQKELTTVWNSPPEPTLAYEADEPVAVAPFALTQFSQTKQVNSMSAALESFYGHVESYGPAKEPLRRLLLASRARIERKSTALRRQMVAETLVERLKVSGELILAHTADLKPGQKTMHAEMVEGQPILIKLDPNLTPVENAQKYFSDYRRAKDSAAAVPSRLQEAEVDLEYADQVLEDLETAETRAEIENVIAEAREAGLINEGKKRARHEKDRGAVSISEPKAFVSPDGFQVLVGRNARQNELVTFRKASPGDPWLHARGVPGAHVVIISNGLHVPERTIEFAASLAAFHSKARLEGWVDVAVADRRNVGRVSGRLSRPGLVTVRGERIVRARPEEPG